MPTGKIPAKRAPKRRTRQPNKVLVPWAGDGPIDDDLAHKLARLLLSDADNTKVEPTGTEGVDETTVQPGEGT